MSPNQSRKDIDDFYNDQLKRRSIEVNTFNKLRKKQDNKGVAKAAPKKEK